MSLISKIKNLCRMHKITFAELERTLGFGNGTIRKWDDQSPSTDRLEKVADYFNVKTDYLLDRELKSDEVPDDTYRMIARASKKMTHEEQERMIQILKLTFKDAFSEDDDDDIDY